MDATNFAYWLNGFAELTGDTPPTEAQWKSIREHLALVFEKVTPPVEEQKWVDLFRWPPQQPARDVPWWERQVQCGSAQTMPDGTARTQC